MAVKRKLNLKGMSLSQLGDLRTEVERAIKRIADVERSALRAKLSELDSLAGDGDAKLRRRASNGQSAKVARKRGKHPLKGKKVPAKYRGPDGEAWSGRGVTPNWLAALEKKGKKRDSFLVKGSN